MRPVPSPFRWRVAVAVAGCSRAARRGSSLAAGAGRGWRWRLISRASPAPWPRCAATALWRPGSSSSSPCCRAWGARLDPGDCVDVEHLFTSCMPTALTEVIAARRSWDSRPPVLLARFDGERHSLPLYTLGAALVEIGFPCRILVDRCRWRRWSPRSADRAGFGVRLGLPQPARPADPAAIPRSGHRSWWWPVVRAGGPGPFAARRAGPYPPRGHGQRVGAPRPLMKERGRTVPPSATPRARCRGRGMPGAEAGGARARSSSPAGRGPAARRPRRASRRGLDLARQKYPEHLEPRRCRGPRPGRCRSSAPGPRRRARRRLLIPSPRCERHVRTDRAWMICRSLHVRDVR